MVYHHPASVVVVECFEECARHLPSVKVCKPVHSVRLPNYLQSVLMRLDDLVIKPMNVNWRDGGKVVVHSTVSSWCTETV